MNKILAYCGAVSLLVSNLPAQTGTASGTAASTIARQPGATGEGNDPSQVNPAGPSQTPGIAVQGNPAGQTGIGAAVNQNQTTVSTIVQFTNLPPAVQSTMQTAIGTNSFGVISTEIREGARYYQVPVQNGAGVTRLVFAENGSLVVTPPQTVPAPAIQAPLNSTSTIVVYDDLDAPLQRAVLEAAGPGPYERIERQAQNGIVTYNVAFRKDGKYTRVRLTDNGKIIDDTREKPSLIAIALPAERTNRMTINDLPMAVQLGIKSRATPAEIEKVKLEKWLDKTVYTVNFYRNGDHQQFRLGKDGTIVQPPVIVSPIVLQETNGVTVATTALDPAELPKAVQETVKKYSSSAPITNVRQTLKDGQTVYLVEFNQNNHLGKVYVAEDGSVVLDEGSVIFEAAGAQIPPPVRPLKFSELPKAVQSTINIQTSSNPPSDAQASVKDGKTIYQVEIEKNGTPTKLQLLEDGSIVKVD